MNARFAADSLDPLVARVGKVAGLLRQIDDDLEVNSNFVRDPVAELGQILKSRQNEVIDLLGELLGRVGSETLGLPAAGDEDQWLPIKDGSGQPTGFYVVLKSAGGLLTVGFGWRWSVTDEGTGLTVRLWAQIPLLSTDGTGPGTRFEVASSTAPMRLAAEVVLADGFGTAEMRFRGVRGSIAIPGKADGKPSAALDALPDVGLVLLGLQLPGETTPRDRSLADLLALPFSTWIETAVALFTAQLRAAGDAGAAKAAEVVEALLPLLGITGTPRLAWEQLPARGTAVFDDWFAALTGSSDAMRGWLAHWQALLRAGAGAPPPVAIAGTGTRADPWRIGVTLSGLQLLVTGAVSSRSDGVRLLTLGLQVGSQSLALAGTLRLQVQGSVEVVSIPIGTAGPVQALPGLNIALALTSSTGDLANHSFPAGHALAALGLLRVGSMTAGFLLDGNGQPAPHWALHRVDCVRGHWEVLDLTSADAVIDGLQDVAGQLIQQLLEQGLGLIAAGDHPGRRVAALLGLVAPHAGGAPAVWPVPLATDGAHIGDFLADPLAAVARYHARCLATASGGAPAWRHLLAEAGALLAAAGVPPAPVRGAGSPADPWRVVLADGDAGLLSLQAHSVTPAGRPQLHWALALEPRALAIDALQLAFGARAELLHLDLSPGTAGAAPTRAHWLPALQADLSLSGALLTPSLAGLTLGADALRTRLAWGPTAGPSWELVLVAPHAQWSGRNAGPLALPDLRLGQPAPAAWNLATPDLGGALGTAGRDAVAELTQYLLGHLALEHGGPAGMGLAALLGLLPADPGIALPAWRGGEHPLALPADFPRLTPVDWGAFFADPRPTLRAHLRRLLSNPAHAAVLLRWLGMAFQGLAPVRTNEGTRLDFEEARDGLGDFPLPAAEDGPVFGDGQEDAPPVDAPLSLPGLETLPFTVDGQGTYEQPYTLGLRAPTVRSVQGLLWLDPAGPPQGDVLAMALQGLAPALRNLGALGPQGLQAIADALQALANADDTLRDALAGVTEGGGAGGLGAALTALHDFLRTSDGLVLTAAQHPGAGGGWAAATAPLVADHVRAVADAAVIAAVRTQVQGWDAAGTGPVLLLGAPFTDNAGWALLKAALGGTAQDFSFRVAGVAPSAVSLAPLGAGRLVAAELAFWNDAPGAALADRLVPLDGPVGQSSQAEQVARLVARIAALQPGRRIVIVAHSASGLAARAALQRAGMATLVRGLVTVGTPHLGVSTPWRGNTALQSALAALQRMAATLPVPGALGQALSALWGFVSERSAGGAPLPWPDHAFVASGSGALATGIDGVALALQLPTIGLPQTLASALQARADQLRAAAAARPAATHLGLGLALASPLPATGPALRVQTSARLDLLQWSLAVGAGTRSLPRLVWHSTLRRRGGWLVGDAAAPVRVRAAEIGCEIDASGVRPLVRLIDVSVNGVLAPLATLRRAVADGPWVPDDLLVPALDALLAQLTTGAGLDEELRAVARLLARLGVLRQRIEAAATDVAGYALHPEGWAALLADARTHVQRQLTALATDATAREALLAQVRRVFGLDAAGLTRLLGTGPDELGPPDTPDKQAWRALRILLQELGLLATPEQGQLPRLDAWLALLRDPVAWAQAQILPLLLAAETPRREALLARLRTALDLREVGQPEVTLRLGQGVALHASTQGRVALRLDGLRLGGALALQGEITLDLLTSPRAEVALRLQPEAVATGLVASLMLQPGSATELQWAIDFGDGSARQAPFERLPFWPLPVDLPARLGRVLPGAVLSTLGTALLDQLLLPRAPEVANALELLGLARRAQGQARARLRPLARVFADPLGWLQSEETLFRRNADSHLVLDPARVVQLGQQMFGLFGLADAAGNVTLPLGLRLRLQGGSSARLTIDAPGTIALADGVTLGGEFALAWAGDGGLGAGGNLALGATLPAGGPWARLVVQAGVDAQGAFTLALGPEGAPLTLLPFAGLDAASAGALAERLLPLLADATLQAIHAAGDAAVKDVVTDLRALAAALQVNTVAGLESIAGDPLAWLRDRFSAASAPAVMTALNDLLSVLPAGAGLSTAAGALRLQPAGSPVALSLGRMPEGIGLGVQLTALDLGPVTLGADFGVGLNDSGTPAPVLTATFSARVDDGVIAPAGVSIRPSVFFSLGSGGVALWAYPIGDEPGSPDFRMQLLPAFDFFVEGNSPGQRASLGDGLLELARRVLVPVAVETVLDTPAVTGWLDSDLGRGVKAGPILVSTGLLTRPAAGRYDLASLSSFTQPERLAMGLVGGALDALSRLFGPVPIVDFGSPDTGLYIAGDTVGSSKRYGLRVQMPVLRLSDDPEIEIVLGGETAWVAAAGGHAPARPGLTVLLVKDSGNGTEAAGSAFVNRFRLEPVFELAGVGLRVSGRGDEPLFDLSGFQLGGVEALLYLRVEVPASASPTFEFGAYGDLEHIAIPLGASNTNPVASSLMSGSNGDSAPVNPRFSVRAAYVKDFWLELGDTPGRNEVWFPIQKSFGPVTLQQIGIRWIGGADLEGAILVDGGVALAGLAVGVDDLSLTIPFADIGNLSKWALGLRGLAVSYNGGGVRIGGGLLEVDLGPNTQDVQYDGLLLVEVGGKSFMAMGSYGVKDGEPSLFVFVVIGIPIGGPPYFFITGLAGGFGYNRGLVVPAIEGLNTFPLVQAMSDSAAVTEEPMRFLQRLGPMAPMERGSYWFAAGLKFSTFSLLNSQALLYVLLNRGLEIGLLGLSKFEMPPSVPLVSVELALKARFSTIEGVVSVEARLTDNSWVLSRDCRLTGGFAFYLWFDGPHAGDFVVTIGGYHPRYTPPAHYPGVPRLGFNWRVSSDVYIKGESYFALTPREVMAGGLLEAVYDSGDVRAWFRAWANMYIQWRPFWFSFDVGISIGVAVDTFLGTAKVEVGASLAVWGPEIGGEVTVDIWLISFTVPFGADRVVRQDPLSWTQFREQLLPPQDDKLFTGGVERGLLGGSPATGPWVVLPEFTLRTETILGTSDIVLGLPQGVLATPSAGYRGTFGIDIKPMARTGVTAEHRVRVMRRGGADVTAKFHLREALSGNVARALWDTDPSHPSDNVIPSYTGVRLGAEIDRLRLDSTGSIDWRKLYDYADNHPLPFARELDARAVMQAPALAALALDTYAQTGSAALWQAQDQVLTGAAFAERRAATLSALSQQGVRVQASGRRGDTTPRGLTRRARRSAPPLLRSLHEGLAAEAVSEVKTRFVPTPAAPEVVRQPVVPVLKAVLRQRAEPTRAGQASLRTTVSDQREAVVLSSEDMSGLLTAPMAGASVQRQAGARSPRASGMALAAPRLVAGSTAPAAAQAWLKALGDAALAGGGGAPDIGTHGAVNRGNALGAPVDPGATLRFELPTRNVSGPVPTLVLGGAATRITALDRSGEPLLDVEAEGAAKLTLPEGTALLAVTGLGRARAQQRPVALGAVTLQEAAHPVPVVGWHAHSTLVALSDQTLQARGALLRLGAPVADLGAAGAVRASRATAGQNGLETWLPKAVKTIALVLEEGPGAGSAELARDLGLSVQGAEVSAEPVIVAAGERVILVYAVLKTDPDATALCVVQAQRASWVAAGVLGMGDTPARWAPLLAETDIDSLVEDGPLTATGSATLHFVT